MPRPNIILVITHDSGTHFGPFGAAVETPHIDRLARQGALFTRAFCTAPQCSPARASILTGLMPHQHGLIGLTHRGFRLRPEVPRLPALLARSGYHTALFGFQHEEPDASLLGYQHVEQPRPRSLIRFVMPLVERFLAGAPPQPFFACVGFAETHRPFPAGHQPDDPAHTKVPAWLPDAPETRADVAMLNGTIRAVDAAVGRIDALLRANRLADNTLLLYTTDHGIAFPRAKATLRDAGTRVALVARGPGGFDSAKVIDRLVSTMDLMPTLLALAGVDPPDALDARSLPPLLANHAAPWREHLFLEQTWHAAYDPVRGIRTERWKYIRAFESRPMMFLPNTDDGLTKWFLMERGEHRAERPAEQLFDLAADPHETHNLADKPAHSAILADLRRRLDAWMHHTADPLLTGPPPLPPGALVTPPGAVHPEQMDAGDDWRRVQ